MTSDHPPTTRRALGVGGMVALAVLVLLVVCLRALLPLDVLAWTTVLTRRACWSDGVVEAAVDAATVAVIVELAAAATIVVMRRGLRAAWAALATVGIGMLASKTLKNLFVRERPSMLPGVALGHSFPSGHVMNTTLATLAVVTLTADFRHARRWRLGAVACLTIITLGRVLLARHWLTDAVGAVLAALAVTGLATRPFARRPLLAPAAAALVLVTALAAVLSRRSLALTLPSALSAPGARTVEVDVTFPHDSREWRGLVLGDEDGGTTWVDGGATITLDVPATFDGDARPPGTAPSVVLALAGRPDIAKRCCVTVSLALNGHALPPFVAFVGWREYRFALPATIVRAGTNELRITVTKDDGSPWRFAAAYVRLTT